MSSKIGISGNYNIPHVGPFPGEPRATVFNDYIKATAMAGGVPFMLPLIQDIKLIEEQVKLMDALMLTGGQDIDPLRYGEEPHKKLEETYAPRDAYDFALLEFAFKYNKPILAICRGMQALNVYCGGTLYQDLSLRPDTELKHNQTAPLQYGSLNIELKEGCLLHSIFKTKALTANSYHHQAIKDLAPGFKVAAYASDGVIEAIEKEGDLPVIGVQWHPEMMLDAHPEMLKLFTAFVQMTKDYGQA